MSISAAKQRKPGSGAAQFRRPMAEVIAETPGAIRDLAPDESPHAVDWYKYDPHKHCCWPLGDPSTPEFRFCGDSPSVRSRYCDRHHERAYRGFRNEAAPAAKS